MDFLLSHWHCIIPAIAIIAGLFLIREKSDKESRPHVLQGIRSEEKDKQKEEVY